MPVRRQTQWIVAATAAIGLAILLGIVILSALNGSNRRTQAVALRGQSYQLMLAAQQLLLHLQDAETGQRGYLITLDPQFLDPYRASVAAIDTDFERLRTLSEDNPRQLSRLSVLKVLADAKLAELDKSIALARAGRDEEGAALVRSGVGKQIMDQARATTAELLKEERRLLAARIDLVVESEAAERARLYTLAAVATLLLLVAAIAGMMSLAAAHRAVREFEARREAEHAANRLSENFARLWDMAAECLCIADRNGGIISVNPACAAALGETQDSFKGTRLSDRFHPDDAARIVESFAPRTGDANLLPIDTRVRHRDGSYRIFSWRMASDGDLVFGTARDVTDERAAQVALVQSETALRQSQKMESIGQLTGGIAHDFNNMLAIVIGSLDMLGRKAGDIPHQSRKLIDSAMEGAKRAATLTAQLLAFARRQPLAPGAIDVNQLTRQLSELLSRTLGKGIRLETVLGAGVWTAYADAGQLENALLNLAVNARDAMDGQGRLTIETSNTHLDDAYVATADGTLEGQYVLIAISDTGCGMDEATQLQAFEPFFTTKPAGQGTGLGLSQVHGFIRQSGGHIRLYSEPGQGTTVKLYLPRAQSDLKPADHASDSKGPVPMARPGETVLLVEDEPGVRAMAEGALISLGYAVHTASSGLAALASLETLADLSLLVTDIVMPDINGRELAERVRAQRPDLAVMFITGYTRNAVIHNGVVDHDVVLLTKPFTVDQIARRVRSVIDGARNTT